MKNIITDNSLIDGLKTINYSIETALKEFLLLNLSDKVSKFKSECDMFRQKYNMNFEDFDKRINLRTAEEDFQEFEDYMAWKFAEEQKTFLQGKLEAIK